MMDGEFLAYLRAQVGAMPPECYKLTLSGSDAKRLYTLDGHPSMNCAFVKDRRRNKAVLLRMITRAEHNVANRIAARLMQ